MTSHLRLASRTILTKGVLNTLLGLVHIVVAFAYEAGKIAGQGSALLQRDYIVWFLGTGLFILFMGLVDILCHSGLKSGSRLAWRVSLMNAVFTLIPGVCGVALYRVSPPLLLLITGSVGLSVLVFTRNDFRQP